MSVRKPQPVIDIFGFPGVGKTHLLNNYINCCSNDIKVINIRKYYNSRFFQALNCIIVLVSFHEMVREISKSNNRSHNSVTTYFWYFANYFKMIISKESRKNSDIASILFLLSSVIVDRFVYKIYKNKNITLLMIEGIYQKSIGLAMRLPAKIKKGVLDKFLDSVERSIYPIFIKPMNDYEYFQKLYLRKRGPTAFLKWKKNIRNVEDKDWMVRTIDQYEKLILDKKPIYTITNSYNKYSEHDFYLEISKIIGDSRVYVISGDIELDI